VTTTNGSSITLAPSGGLALLIALAALNVSACAPIPSSAGRDEGSPGASEATRAAGASRGREAEEPKAPAPSDGSRGAEGTAKGASFAVVELFTSEGCSSCPPADNVLHALAQEAQGRPVFLLSFHVDYWNDLGWPDPFSAEAFTDRQRAYARAGSGSGLYTPQMIVGGRDAFIGSNAGEARRRIEESLARPALAAVSLRARVDPGASHVDVAYTVTGATEDAVLNVALVERDLVVRVLRGENAGRMLRHENVVRAFETASASRSPEGSVRLALPPSMDRSRASIIGYAQRRASLEIIGATSAVIE
jgi:hypothetical protein